MLEYARSHTFRPCHYTTPLAARHVERAMHDVVSAIKGPPKIVSPLSANYKTVWQLQKINVNRISMIGGDGQLRTGQSPKMNRSSTVLHETHLFKSRPSILHALGPSVTSLLTTSPLLAHAILHFHPARAVGLPRPLADVLTATSLPMCWCTSMVRTLTQQETRRCRRTP